MIGAHHTSMDSQEMSLTLDLGTEFYGGYNVLRDQGQRSSAAILKRQGKHCRSYFFPFLFFLKITELLNIYEELVYI